MPILSNGIPSNLINSSLLFLGRRFDSARLHRNLDLYGIIHYNYLIIIIFQRKLDNHEFYHR